MKSMVTWPVHGANEIAEKEEGALEDANQVDWTGGHIVSDLLGERHDARREFVLDRLRQCGGLSSSCDRLTWATDDAEGTSDE